MSLGRKLKRCYQCPRCTSEKIHFYRHALTGGLRQFVQLFDAELRSTGVRPPPIVVDVPMGNENGESVERDPE